MQMSKIRRKEEDREEDEAYRRDLSEIKSVCCRIVSHGQFVSELIPSKAVAAVLDTPKFDDEIKRAAYQRMKDLDIPINTRGTPFLSLLLTRTATAKFLMTDADCRQVADPNLLEDDEVNIFLTTLLASRQSI